MTFDSKKYYENYRNLFITDGWKQYVEDAKESLLSLSLENCKTWEEYLETRTKIKFINNIISFESLIKDQEQFVEDNLEVYDDSL